MSTAEYPDALTRRIELLAAASVEEPEGESNAVAALVGVLRAEIGAVRAELGSLRSETGAVRSDLDGLGGRLTGSVAAGRSETGTLVRRVAELAIRIDGVGGRIDEVRDGLPSLSRELSEGLAAVPTRTTARMDELSAQLSEAVAGRVETAASDIRRMLDAALDRETRTSEGAAAALEDTRGALEGRLAVLEDALNLVSERLEAFARDGARTTTEKLTALEVGVGLLSSRIEDEGRSNAELLVGRLRDVHDTQLTALESTLFDRLSDVLRVRDDELRRDVLGALEAARAEAAQDREAVRELAGSVRTALDGFSAVLDRSLVGLGRSVSTALAEGRQDDRSRLDDLSGALLDAMAAVQADVSERAVAAAALTTGVQTALEDRVEALRSQLGTAMTVLRSDVATEVGLLTPRVDELVVAGASTHEALRALRSDVIATTEALRDRLVAAGTDSTEVLRAAMTETRAEVAEITRALREDLLDRIEEKYSGVSERIGEITIQVAGSSASARDVSERVAALAQLSERSRDAIEQVGTGVVSAADALAEDVAARSDRQLATLAAGSSELSDAVDRRLTALEQALTGRLADVGTQVEESTTRTRISSQAVAELAELAGRHRDEVEQQLGGVRSDATGAARELLQVTEARLASLSDRFSALDAKVVEQQAAVADRLGVLDATVTRAAATTAEAAEAVSGLDATTTDLEQTLGGFRAEWPTRTFEVVEGAKAVAEGVVREVREEVSAQLERVRSELARAAGSVDEAREDVVLGTDRLADVGDVLVSYLEQRDRLLEAERDRVLHDVLDTFASGLSAKERAALSGRVGDAVARRRDARDADRYRTAVGEPVAPKVDVPPDVRRMAERVPTRPARPAEPAEPAPAPAAATPAVGPAGTDSADAPTPAQGSPARALSTAKVALPKVAVTTAAPGSTVVVRPAPPRASGAVSAAARPAPSAGDEPVPEGPPKEPADAVGGSTPPPAPARAVKAPGAATRAPARVVRPPARAARPPMKEARPPAKAATAPQSAAQTGSTATGSASSGSTSSGSTTSAPAARAAATGAAAGTSRPAGGSDRRARVDVMPEVRSPGLAIEAAAPTPAASRPAPLRPEAQDDPQTSWGSRPSAEPGQPGEDEDASVRRLFRRRKP